MTRGAESSAQASAWSVFLAFLRLGVTSFGGPVAHLGYFRQEFVERRKWLDDRRYWQYLGYYSAAGTQPRPFLVR